MAAKKPSDVQLLKPNGSAPAQNQAFSGSGAAKEPSDVQLLKPNGSASAQYQALSSSGAAKKPSDPADKHPDLQLLKPNWSAPAHIQAFFSTRTGGYSQGAYAALNLGVHVADDPLIVCKNRGLLSKTLSLPEKLCWLNQIHSTILVRVDESTPTGITADAAWTVDKQQPCIVMTADCLPILVTDKLGSFVCAIHAGWRGLCDGIIEKSISSICQELAVNSNDLLVWLGPCIGKTAFAVGDEVRAAFIAENEQAKIAFSAFEDRWLADLHQLARLRLAPFNVFEITASEYCTYNEAGLFYSYRRDNITGRMAALIWINETAG